MEHTERCLEHQERIAMSRAQWLHDHPNHCRACHGYGVLPVISDPDTIWETCPICVDNGLCPQCTQKLDMVHCPNCGWKAGDDGLPKSWDEAVGEDRCGCEIPNHSPNSHIGGLDWL